MKASFRNSCTTPLFDATASWLVTSVSWSWIMATMTRSWELRQMRSPAWRFGTGFNYAWCDAVRDAASSDSWEGSP